MSKLKVIVAGGGLGGLCLAQALRRAKVDVAVYERDARPGERPQGYRLHINSDGVNALAEALPPRLYDLFQATSTRPHPFTTLLDPSLTVRHQMQLATEAEPVHLVVNRATLRQILLAGLEDVVTFGAPIAGYERDDAGVTVVLGNGERLRCDVLVGADGIHSPVRRQRVPEARLQDTCLRLLYARIPMHDALQVVPEHARSDVFAVAADNDKRFIGLAPVTFQRAPSEAAAMLAPGVRLDDPGDYVMCIVGARRERFDGTALHRGMDGPALHRCALQLLATWPAATRGIVERVDPASLFLIEVHTSVPCGALSPSNVTVLGDAIHAMSPAIGVGANTALRDAALLARRLVAADRDGESLVSAIGAYEAEMMRYGFDAVRRSAANGTRLVGQEPLPE